MSTVGEMGGVPAIPWIDDTSSLKKLSDAEEKIQAAYLRIQHLLEVNPGQTAELQASLDAIKVNFDTIIQIKYNLNLAGLDGVVMTPEQIFKLEGKYLLFSETEKILFKELHLDLYLQII